MGKNRSLTYRWGADLNESGTYSYFGGHEIDLVQYEYQVLVWCFFLFSCQYLVNLQPSELTYSNVFFNGPTSCTNRISGIYAVK